MPTLEGKEALDEFFLKTVAAHIAKAENPALEHLPMDKIPAQALQKVLNRIKPIPVPILKKSK